MSEVDEHFASIADDVDDIKRECKVMKDDGHFANPLILRGVAHILQIINGVEKILVKEKRK